MSALEWDESFSCLQHLQLHITYYIVLISFLLGPELITGSLVSVWLSLPSFKKSEIVHGFDF